MLWVQEISFNSGTAVESILDAKGESLPAIPEQPHQDEDEEIMPPSPQSTSTITIITSNDDDGDGNNDDSTSWDNDDMYGNNNVVSV